MMVILDASKGSQKAIGKDTAVDLLIQMIENGPREFDFNREQLQEVLRLGAQVFIEECTLLEVDALLDFLSSQAEQYSPTLQIPVPCMVYGDTHGQYSDLLRWFNLNGWPYETRCVFLGDFVDRGSHGVELFAMLTCLKVCFPDNLFVLRGNHEEESLNQLYSFATEVYNKFDGRSTGLHSFAKCLNRNIFQRNSPNRKDRRTPCTTISRDIREIVRPIDEFIKGTLACDLVWSDPDTLNTVAEYEPNFEREATVGIGQLFSQAAVKDVCKRLKVKMIIRGHQAPLHGYARWAGGLLITLFSAPAYKGDTEETVNLGACIEAPVSGDLIVKQLKVTETVRRKRARDVHTRHKAHRSSLLDPSHNFLEVLPNAVGNDLPLNESKIYKS
ncbi:unnamed protein product [Heligmosomoides polygyrus]|uniref:Serine/threonine-protein phosphatase n=1 Tax=Heligmosomoides polygyrus TaxID=6339 RepID=A0A3P8C6V9_HELPZ|nr:unnamed protein product [Heligmosomoides polygyrus]